MRAILCAVLMLAPWVGIVRATAVDTRAVDVLIDRAGSAWSRPSDLDELAALDVSLMPYLLERAATARGPHGGHSYSGLLYGVVNRRASELFPLLLDHVLTEADPWTSDGLAQLSHEQLASILRLLNHADREVVDRANAALEEVAERHGALAAYFANQHRQLLIELMLDARPAFPGSLPALLAYANPRPYEVGSKVVAAMADEAFSVRVAGVRALATLGIPMPEAAAALTEILLTDDYVGSSERAAAQVGEPLRRLRKPMGLRLCTVIG